MFAVLHIADFPLHAVLRTEPSLGGRAVVPAALFDDSRKKSLVLVANPAARAAGVAPGLTAPQAMARCATLIVRTPRPAAEAEARSVLLAIGFTLSPSIEDTAPGICTIDLKGTDPARHVELASRAVAQLAALGLPATAGIARTPLLALYAARTTLGQSGRARRPRRAALDDGSAGGFALPATTASVLQITDEKNFLAPLPLATANPSPALADVFLGWGLRTLGDLTALPRDEIIRRFGAEGLALRTRATGGATRPLHLVAPPRTFFAQMEFEHEVETLEPLLFVLRRFLDRLTLELCAAQQVAVELALTLRLENESRHTRQFRLPEPTGDVEILFRTLHTHLESLQTTSSIASVELRIVPTRPLVRQQGLFETGLRDPHGFAETLARVVALVGSDRVGTPQLEDSHRPDAVKLTSPLAVIPPAAEIAVHPAVGLPLRRFRPPLSVKLEFTGQRPTFAWTELFHGAIETIRGPWRSNGDWWQPDHTWARIEWDIALTGGGLYRLLLVGDNWFIEGEYD